MMPSSANRFIKRVFLLLLALVTTLVVVLGQSASGQSASRPTIAIQTNYYQILGSTAAELRSQMNRYGPQDPNTGRRFDAYTRWNVHWRYRYNKHRNRCQITTATVRAEITYTMPQWSQTSQASLALRQRWNQYIAALRFHEDGHKQHGVDAAVQILNLLESFPAKPSCVELETSANAAAMDFINYYAEQDREYDRRTQHGRTQGAVFP